MYFDRTVTLRHLSYNAETDSDIETETVFQGVSWYAQRRATPNSDGMRAATIVKCRIPESVLGTSPLPCIGDKLECCGTTVTVTAVHDNRGRGPAGHVYVEGE